MRRFLSVLVGVFGLWLFVGGVISVATTESGSFLPAMWSSLLLGTAILAGSVLLWRGRAQHGAGRQAYAADERRSGARG
jgi:hypothetical protein